VRRTVERAMCAVLSTCSLTRPSPWSRPATDESPTA
jgi:hypothetical protein